MKMKRMIAILCVCLLITGCKKSYNDTANVLETTGEGYFTVIKKWGNSVDVYEIVYANDTKVKYLIWNGFRRGSITPLYNADGSLQVYEEVEE